MTAIPFNARAVRAIRIVLGCSLLLVISWPAARSQPLLFKDDKKAVEKDEKKPEEKKDEQPKARTREQTAKPPGEPGEVEASFADGSNLKMVLRDDKIALITPHGKLSIAVADIRRIEFATRVSEEDAKRIRAAIADLGSTEFDKREAASAQLLKLGKKAYPAIVGAAADKDREVVRRCQQLIAQISQRVPAQELVVREKDVIHTADSRIAGRIEGEALKAHTSQFGAVQVKLADVRGLQSSAVKENGATMGITTGRDWRQMQMRAAQQMDIARKLQMEAEMMRQQEMMNRMKK
jgi:hypothetical protein